MPDSSVGCDLVAEFDRGVNPRQWFEASARSMHDNSSIIEYATPNGLVHIHALDFVHVHLDRMATNEAPFVYDPAVGHR